MRPVIALSSPSGDPGGGPMAVLSQVFGRRRRKAQDADHSRRLLFSATIRDAAELLPRYEVDNIFVSEKFKTRFPDFRVTPFLEGLAAIRDDRPAP
jgi:hypothetical protein